MKVTIRINQLYLLAKETPYYYDQCSTNRSKYDVSNEIHKISCPDIIRITLLNKLKTGIVRINFSYFTKEINASKLVDTPKYLLVCNDLDFHAMKLDGTCIPESLVSHHVIPLNDKLKAIVKTVDDFHIKMASLRLKLEEVNGEIDQHVKYYEELRKLPNELIDICADAAYDHNEFINYNNEMVEFLTGDTKS